MRRRFSMRVAGLATALALTVAGIPAVATASNDSALGHEHGSHKKELLNVGYFTQWGIYGRNFQVKDLDTSGAADKLTHINYAFGNVSAAGKCFIDNIPGEGDAWADYQRPVPAEQSVDGVADAWGEPLNGNFGQLLKLKAKHPDLKVNISLGGWSWSTYFSDAALTPESRRAFVESCIDLYIKGNLVNLDGGSGGPGSGAGVFDGIDLDWEWPSSPGDVGNVVRPEDRENFTALVKEFRKQLDALGRTTHKHYELTAFLPANPAFMDAGYEAKKVFRYLDFATVQGYDFHGTWETVTNHQSALFEPEGAPITPDFSGDRAVQEWLDRGAPRKKVVLGVPFYGQGWTGVTGGGDGLFQPATGPAPATFGPGIEDWEALRTLLDQGYTLYRDTDSGHAWLFNGTTFWTYDDPDVLAQKTAYIHEERLAGAMSWSLDGDDGNATLTKALWAGLQDDDRHHRR